MKYNELLKEFDEDRKKFYPNRGGGHNLNRARKSYYARRKEGYSREDIAKAFERYDEYCDFNGTTNTSFVKMLSTFLADAENLEIKWETNYATTSGSSSRMLERCETNISRRY